MLNRKNWSAEFNTRFDSRLAEMQELFNILYPNDADAFDRLTQRLYDCFRQRKASLRKRDAVRESDPNWYRRNDLVGMMMYTNCFAGTLNGVREKLPYVQQCGVNCLHLMPLLESPEGRSDGGYAVSDYRKVDPKLGTMEDLAALADACHRRNINVCMDFVMNHTSEDHEWAKRARAGEKEYQDRYFFYDDREIPDQYEKTVPQVFPTTAPGNFTYLEDAAKYVMTMFYPYQWDLNYRNPTVFIEMMDNMLNLCNHGIDIVRIDAVPYIWKKLGTDCRNQPEVHLIVRLVRLICEVVCPGVLLLGEVVMEPVKVAPYFGTEEKPECHMLYNATSMCTTWSTVATRDVRLLRHNLDIMASLPRSYIWLNYIRCHDDIGWGLDYAFLRQFGIEETPHKRFITDYLMGKVDWSNGRGESYNDDPVTGDARLCGTAASLVGVEKGIYEQNEPLIQKAINCDLMLHAFVMTQSGIPMLYSGDEIAALNDYTYHDDPNKREDSRYLHRGDFNWKNAAKISQPGTVEQRMFDGLRKLETVRANEPVFNADAAFHTCDTGSDNVLGLVRENGTDTLLALFNFSENPVTLYFGDENWQDLLAGEPLNLGQFTLPAYGFLWLKR